MKSLAFKIAFVFFISGLLIISLIGYVERKTISTYENNLPYIRLGDQVRNYTAEGHLALEEYLSGDKGINVDNDIIKKFSWCSNMLQAAYDGKQSELGNFKKSDNVDVRALIKESIIGIDKLTTHAQEIIAKNNAAVNSSSDPAGIAIRADDKLAIQFNNQFDQVQLSLTQLVDTITNDVKSDSMYLNVVSWTSLVILAIAIIGLTLMLYRLQRKGDSIVKENSMRMEMQARSVTSLSTFIESISAGDFNVELDLGADAGLTGTLVTMRDKLRDNAENDRKRNWSTSGLAQIGELLRTHTNSTEELYDNILRFLVKYTKSNQGGLFLLNEEAENDTYLELAACYAFERKKYLKKQVAVGEGMIGQCFLEGQRIYLLEVPQEYITITSGLGGSNPNALLIVPMKVNDKIFGVLEIATFGKYEEYEIELVEKLAETIASTIATVRVNDSTRILLEKTQQQAEEMRAQEEEMRQNMEELEATQEEMRRKEKHIQDMLEGEKQRNEFNNKSRQIMLNLSKDNDLLAGRWERSIEKIASAIGKQIQISRTSIWRFDDAKNKIYCEKMFVKDKGSFEAGKEFVESEVPGYFRVLKKENIIVVKDAMNSAETRDLVDNYLRPLSIQSVLYVPFLNEGKLAGFIGCEQQHEQTEWHDDHIEFLKSAADLLTVTLNTVRINAMLSNLSEAQETLQTIIDNLPRAVFWKDRDLRIQGCNRIFAKVAGLASHKEMIGKSDFDMPWKEHAEAYRADDLSVMNSKEARIDQEERNVNSDGAESWVLTSKVPVLNTNGEVVAVLGMFEDITERKKKDADVQQKLKELEEIKKILATRKN